MEESQKSKFGSKNRLGGITFPFVVTWSHGPGGLIRLNRWLCDCNQCGSGTGWDRLRSSLSCRMSVILWGWMTVYCANNSRKKKNKYNSVWLGDGENVLLPILHPAWMAWVRLNLNIKSFGHHPGRSRLHNNAKSSLRPLAGSRIVLRPSLVWLGCREARGTLKRKYERLF